MPKPITDKLREQWRNANKKRTAKMCAFGIAVRLHYGCVNPKCKWQGDYDAEILQFHHLDPTVKKGNINEFRTRNKKFAEINKCCVLCANCHQLVEKGKVDASKFVKCNVADDGKIVP